MGVQALPVNAGALHDHEFDVLLDKPGRQRSAIAPEAAEFPAHVFDGAIGMFDDHRDDVQHAVHVDAGNVPVKWGQSFHHIALMTRIRSGRKGHR